MGVTLAPLSLPEVGARRDLLEAPFETAPRSVSISGVLKGTHFWSSFKEILSAQSFTSQRRGEASMIEKQPSLHR